MFSEPTSNDLSALHDIHLPKAIGWWPLAPGWYLLAIITIIFCLLIIVLSRRYYRNTQAKRKALLTLTVYQQQYEQEGNSQCASAQVSELLKRVALVYYPRQEVASLQGEAWITFLNGTAKGVNFNAVRRQLLELPWRPSQNQSLQLLFDTARKWITRQRKPCSN